MKEFASIESFHRHLNKIIQQYPRHEARAAKAVGAILEKEAKDMIGHLNEGWRDLRPATKEDKERLGYVFNSDYNPLYRTGELRDSIHFVYSLSRRKLFLGSDSDIMEYHEKGTKYIPARPVLSTTMYKAASTINYVFGSMLQGWAAGKPIQAKKALSLKRGTYGSI